MTIVEQFEVLLQNKIRLSKGDYLEINAGHLHREFGGYPSKTHNMPCCCQAMRNIMKDGDIIVNEPPSGQGASLTIQYKLPR